MGHRQAFLGGSAFASVDFLVFSAKAMADPDFKDAAKFVPHVQDVMALIEDLQVDGTTIHEFLAT